MTTTPPSETRSHRGFRSRLRATIGMAVLALVLPACASTPRTATPNASALGAMHDTWSTLSNLPGTDCAHGTPFHLDVHPGAPDRVAIFFNGGGACWRAAECDPLGRVTYTTRADSANAPGRAGIFDLENPQNPLRDFTIVFVPYCTGDVHLGARTVDYEAAATPVRAAHRFAIRHDGARNADAALAWVYGAIANPRVVFVAGSSAGAIPSPVFAARLASHYPSARVVQLGDAAGGYGTREAPGLLAHWGATPALRRDPALASLASLPDSTFTFEALYAAAARATPRVQFAQYNAVDDATQLFFLSLLGIRGVPLSRFLAADLATIRRTVPGFRSYVAPGRVHTILRGPAVYTTTVDGVRFRDWLDDLVAGRAVPDVGESLLTR